MNELNYIVEKTAKEAVKVIELDMPVSKLAILKNNIYDTDSIIKKTTSKTHYNNYFDFIVRSLIFNTFNKKQALKFINKYEYDRYHWFNMLPKRYQTMVKMG